MEGGAGGKAGFHGACGLRGASPSPGAQPPSPPSEGPVQQARFSPCRSRSKSTQAKKNTGSTIDRATQAPYSAIYSQAASHSPPLSPRPCQPAPVIHPCQARQSFLPSYPLIVPPHALLWWTDVVGCRQTERKLSVHLPPSAVSRRKFRPARSCSLTGIGYFPSAFSSRSSRSVPASPHSPSSLSLSARLGVSLEPRSPPSGAGKAPCAGKRCVSNAGLPASAFLLR